jgi:hypothetical protein
VLFLCSEVSDGHRSHRVPDLVTWIIHHPGFRVASYTVGKKGHVRFRRRLHQNPRCLLDYRFVQPDLS